MKYSKKLGAFLAALATLILLAYLKADSGAYTALGVLGGTYLVAQGGPDTATAWKGSRE